MTSYIYFAQSQNTGHIKIGFSSNPLARINNLHSSNSDSVKLIAVYKGTKILEKKLHNRFKNFKIKGEWFTEEVLKYTKSKKSVDLKPFNTKKEKVRQKNRNTVKKMSYFNYNIKILLTDKSMSKVANECDIAPSVLHSWMNDVFPSSKNFYGILNISKKFSISIEDLFFNKIVYKKQYEIEK